MTNQDKPMSEALDAVRGMMEADRAGQAPQPPVAAEPVEFDHTMEAPADVTASGDAPTAPPGRAEVLEEMVMEQVTPMVRDWLEEHLPGIVARAVEREVRDLMGRRDD